MNNTPHPKRLRHCGLTPDEGSAGEQSRSRRKPYPHARRSLPSVPRVHPLHRDRGRSARHRAVPPRQLPRAASGGGVRVTFLGNTYDLAAYRRPGQRYHCAGFVPDVQYGLLLPAAGPDHPGPDRRRLGQSGRGRSSHAHLVVDRHRSRASFSCGRAAGIILYVAFIVLMIYLGKVD